MTKTMMERKFGEQFGRKTHTYIIRPLNNIHASETVRYVADENIMKQTRRKVSFCSRTYQTKIISGRYIHCDPWSKGNPMKISDTTTSTFSLVERCAENYCLLSTSFRGWWPPEPSTIFNRFHMELSNLWLVLSVVVFSLDYQLINNLWNE